MVSVPVTLGKAASAARESSLKDVCACHHQPIDRTERCSVTHKAPDAKVKGVETQDQSFHVLNGREMVAIEAATKQDTLDVLDVQEIKNLPMEFAMGTYYLRADKKVRGSEQPMAVLTLALAKSGFGLVVKWCNSSTQKLCVIHAQPKTGILLLTQIPMKADMRDVGEDERRHFKADVSNQQIDQMIKLLEATKNSNGFDHEAYSDEGYALRRVAVDKVLDGTPETKAEPEPELKINAEDIMVMINKSIEATKQ
jgi:non-homologous end joining protein Ku